MIAVAGFVYIVFLLFVCAGMVAAPVMIVAGVVRWFRDRRGSRRPGPEIDAWPRPPMRASGFEREQAIARLRGHWQEARLSVDELESRVGIALAARWGHELEHVLSDLPAAATARFRGWLYAAAAYNLCWGGLTVLAPAAMAHVAGVSGNLAVWQAVGMMVLVYAPAYWWAGRYPERHPHLVAIGLLGKTLGIAGFLWALGAGALPARFGLITLTNDVLWVPAFAAYLRAAARERGGWHVLLTGA